MIVVTGGEPLLCNDLEEFGQKNTAQEFHWGMVTNGLWLTENRHFPPLIFILAFINKFII